MKNKLVLGILAGVALGAVAGLLIAPAKGCDTRRKMRDAGCDFFDNFKEKYNHLIDDITSTLDSVAHHDEMNADQPTSLDSTTAVL